MSLRSFTRCLFGFCLLIASIETNHSVFGTYKNGSENTIVSNHFYNHLHRHGIHIDGPRRINFPRSVVTEYAQEIYSSEQTLRLTNKNFQRGWTLKGKVFLDKLFGIHSWTSLPAEFRFTSISWVGGGNGSSAGINIHPNGEYIEADPGFGQGTYDIKFEVVLQVPPFPDADRYYGVLAFIIQ